MNKIWAYQVWNYGLGNFINLTPALKLLSEHLGYRIPVFFDLDFIKQCFLDCDFIQILEKKPENNPLIGSWLVNGRNDCPDYINVYREVRKVYPLGDVIPHTYVDRCEEIEVKDHDYTLFIRGSGSENLAYLASKMPEDHYYREYMTGKCIFTGSTIDLERSKGLFDGMPFRVGNVRESLALIREADKVVTNDSGLAHAAAAMNKHMVILWKNTSLPKNASPGKHTIYRMCHE